MKKILVALACFLALAAPTYADQSAVQVPANLYPATASLVAETIDNATFDCAWGFDCQAGMALIHTKSQDDLKRSGGWEQDASIPKHPNYLFKLFRSTYDSSNPTNPYSEAAFGDFEQTLMSVGFPLDKVPKIGSDVAGVTVKNGNMAIFFLAAWQGDVEVEAGVMYRHNRRVEARHDLLNQVRWALANGTQE